MQVWCDWQVTLCDPHLSALEVRFSRRCAIQIDVYLYLTTHAQHMARVCCWMSRVAVAKMRSISAADAASAKSGSSESSGSATACLSPQGPKTRRRRRRRWLLSSRRGRRGAAGNSICIHCAPWLLIVNDDITTTLIYVSTFCDSQQNDLPNKM